MAVLADVARRHVRRPFARCVDAVVTAGAVARDVRVIEGCGYPAVGRVAVVTGVAAREVPGVFAGRHRAVMARRAGTEHLRVVDAVRGRPLHRVMAVLANVARRHVRRPLAGCVDAVVTAEAVARDIRMIEGGRYPAIRGVAVVAGIGTRDMSRIFAGRDGSVVTRGAGTEHLRVIDAVGGRPEDFVVAVLADVRGTDMRRTLADRVDAVMAAHTVA